MSDESVALGEVVEREISTVSLPVDPEPVELGGLLFVVFIFSSVAGYFLINALMGISTCSPLAVIGGLGVGAGVLQVVERLIKKNYNSRKFLKLSAESIFIDRRGKHAQHINPQQQVNVLMWRFEVSRRSRVPKGWWVVGLALEQEETYLPVYTLISPADLEALEHADHFTLLANKKDRNARNQAGDSVLRDAGMDTRVTGLQRRLYMAEMARTMDGVEMASETFMDYMGWLRTNFREWMPA